MFNFKLLIFIVLLISSSVLCEISDKRLCANEDCSEVISLARTLINYKFPSEGLMKFAVNQNVKVYSKAAGSNLEIWGVEINGVRGYVPHKSIRETKILFKGDLILVDTELNKKDTEKVIENEKNNETFEVIDGTTIYLPPTPPPIDPTVPVEKIEPTAAPQSQIENTQTLSSNDKDKESETIKLKDNSNSNENEDKEKKEESKENLNQKSDEEYDEDDDDSTVEDEDDEEFEDDDEDDDEEEEDSPEVKTENKPDIVQQTSNDVDLKKAEKQEELNVLKEKQEMENSSEKEAQKEDLNIVKSEKSEDKADKVIVENSESAKLKLGEGSSVLDNVVDSAKQDVALDPTKINDKVPIEPLDSVKDKQPLVSEIKENVEKKTEDLMTGNLQDNNGNENEKLTLTESSQVVKDQSNLNLENQSITNDKPELLIVNSEENKIQTPEENALPDLNNISQNNNDNILLQQQQQTESQEKEKELNSNNVSENGGELLQGLPQGSSDLVNNNNEKAKEDVLNVEPVVSQDINDVTLASDKKEEEKQDDLSLNLTENTTEVPISSSNLQPEDTLSTIGVDVTPPPPPLFNLHPGTLPTLDNVEVVTEPAAIDNNLNKNEEIEVQNESEKSSSEQTETAGKEEIKTTENVNINNSEEQADQTGGNNWFFTSPQENLNSKEEVITSSTSDQSGEVKDTENVNNVSEENTGSSWFFSSPQESKDDNNNEINSNLNKEEVITSSTSDQSESSEVKETENVNNNNSEEEKASSWFFSPPQENNNENQNANKEETHSSSTTNQGDEGLVSKKIADAGSCDINPEFCEQADAAAAAIIKNEDDGIFSGLTSQSFSDAINIDFTDIYKLIGTIFVAGATVTVFLWGYIIFDKKKRESFLVAKINVLEKQLLLETKNAEILNEQLANPVERVEIKELISAEELELLQQELENLQTTKAALEDQIQTLEKELENSTEVGLELNRMLQDILNSQNGSDTLIANVEQLQRQLVEQQATINTVNESLNIKDTENHELQLELEIKNKKLTDLQEEYVTLVSNLTELEEEKDQINGKYETEISELKTQLAKSKEGLDAEKTKYKQDITALKKQLKENKRNLEMKINEYNILKDSIQDFKNNDNAKSIVDVSALRAEVQQLKKDNKAFAEHIKQEDQSKYELQKKVEITEGQLQEFRQKYDEADREKLEAQTKLQVLSNYFTEKEKELQRELSKQESIWLEKQGEATSVTERIKYMQDELQNCKLLNESLKKEIVQQEVELKSQITVLEKKAHDSWVEARQAERKLETAKQEAAQLRNRLTLRERSYNEEKSQNRLQSPIEQNGEIPVSPLHMQETPASPPLIFGTRDHLTTSPPLPPPGLPPFLPPPPGVPFMPPHMPGVPFMPPPPSMFPGDHRPPPLGMQSPPLNSRYSPDSNSPSPSYDEYDPSPPHHYNSYGRDDRRNIRRPAPVRNNHNMRKGTNMSSGSGHSNESIEKINRHNSKV